MAFLNKILLTPLFCCYISITFSQSASQKSVDETCDCVKKIDASLSEDQRTGQAFGCMVTSIGKYMPQLKKEYNIKITDEKEAGRAVGRNVGGKLSQECPEMAAYFLKIAAASQQTTSPGQSDIDPDTLKLNAKICETFKQGKYKSDKIYMNKKAMDNPDATAYTEIKNGFVYDYSNSQKSVTKWSLRWVNGCEWEQTLVETNDPTLNGIFKKGDKINIKAIGSTTDGRLYVNSKMAGLDFILLIHKMN